MVRKTLILKHILLLSIRHLSKITNNKLKSKNLVKDQPQQLVLWTPLAKNIQVIYAQLVQNYLIKENDLHVQLNYRNIETNYYQYYRKKVLALLHWKKCFFDGFLSINKYLCFCKLLIKTSWLHPQIISVKAYFKNNSKNYSKLAITETISNLASGNVKFEEINTKQVNNFSSKWFK